MKLIDRDIFLIEDDSIDIINVKLALRKINFKAKLHVARNGKEAFDLLGQIYKESKEKSPIGFILLDLELPGMSGIDVLKKLREDSIMKSIPVFVLSNTDDEALICKAYSYNIAGYLKKQGTSEEIFHSFKRLNEFWNLCEAK